MAKRKGTSKLQLVRDAIATLGKDALPKAIQAEVKTKNKRNLDLNLISNYKNIVLKEGGAAGKKTGKKKLGRPKKVAAPAAASKNGKGGISIDEIKAVKALADRIGAAKLKELAAVLG